MKELNTMIPSHFIITFQKYYFINQELKLINQNLSNKGETMAN